MRTLHAVREAFHRYLLLVFPAQRQHSTQDRFVFRHRWGQRDVVKWDNRCTMHCATPYDAGAERRIIHRTVVIGDVPV